MRLIIVTFASPGNVNGRVVADKTSGNTFTSSQILDQMTTCNMKCP